MNIAFEKRPFGMTIWSNDKADREFGHGAQVSALADEDGPLAKILKVGSQLVSVGHHHVSQMKHPEILNIIANEDLPCSLGFTYDAIAVAQEVENEQYSDSNLTMVKSGRG